MKFLAFYGFRRLQPQNLGKSFTYGSCLYDYMKQGFDEESEAEELIQDYVANKLGVNIEIVHDLPYRAIIEIPSLDVYDDIARLLYFNDENDD